MDALKTFGVILWPLALLAWTLLIFGAGFFLGKAHGAYG